MQNWNANANTNQKQTGFTSGDAYSGNGGVRNFMPNVPTACGEMIQAPATNMTGNDGISGVSTANFC